MSYTIGVSSGWWGIAKTPDLLGLGFKAMSAATYGVTFVQLDIESPSEFREPLLQQQLNIAREDLGLQYGIHGEFDMRLENSIKDFWDIFQERLVDQIRGAAETKTSYMLFHASSEPPPTFGAAMIGTRFYRLVAPDGSTLFNILRAFQSSGEGENRKFSSNKYPYLTHDQIDRIRKIVLENYLRGGVEPSDPGYREFIDLINPYETTGALIQVFDIRENLTRKLLEKLVPELEERARIKGGTVPVPRKDQTGQVIRDPLTGQVVVDQQPIKEFIDDFNRLREESGAPYDDYINMLARFIGVHGEELSKIIQRVREQSREDEYNDVEKFLLKQINERYIPFFGFDERLAYEVVGRLLEGSPQWKKICHTDYVRNQLSTQFAVEGRKLNESEKIDDYIKVDNLLRSSDRRVQALVSTVVAMEYINGHFEAPMQYRDPDSGKFTVQKNKEGKTLTIKDYIKENNIVICFETPQIENKQEGLMRIVRSEHIYHLVKKVRSFNGNENHLSNNVFMALDFEHMLTHNLNIELELQELPKDDGGKDGGGALCKVIHVGQPKPVHPAHAPIYVGSEAQELVYGYLYELRKKGFKDGWVVFERGAGQSPLEWMRSSVYAMRLIVEYLEKDTEPAKLPPEFYGISPESEFSEQRQMSIIRHHFFAPLTGTLAIPEEEHTFLGRVATDRPGGAVPPEKWKKEEFR